MSRQWLKVELFHQIEAMPPRRAGRAAGSPPPRSRARADARASRLRRVSARGIASRGHAAALPRVEADHAAERGEPRVPAVVADHPFARRAAHARRPAPAHRARTGWQRPARPASSATSRSRPGTASIPSKAPGEATTGRAIAIASSTLFWMPRAIRSGATTTDAAASQGRTSGTSPVTMTPGRPASASHRRRRAAADDGEVEIGRLSRSLGSTSSANQRSPPRHWAR